MKAGNKGNNKGGGGLLKFLITIGGGGAAVWIAGALVGVIGLIAIAQVTSAYQIIFKKDEITIEKEWEDDPEDDSCICGCDACKKFHSGESNNSTGNENTENGNNSGSTGIDTGAITVSGEAWSVPGLSAEASANAKEIYTILTTELGYNNVAACAVLGNAWEESTMDPNAWGPKTTHGKKRNEKPNGCSYYGLWQGGIQYVLATSDAAGWDKVSAERGWDIDSVRGQTLLMDNYAAHEGGATSRFNTACSGYTAFKQLTDLTTATDAFIAGYENCYSSSGGEPISVPYQPSKHNHGNYQNVTRRRNYAKTIADYIATISTSNNTGSTGMTITGQNNTNSNTEETKVAQYYSPDYSVERLADDLGDMDLSKFNNTSAKIIIAAENGKDISTERGMQYNIPLYSGYTMPADENTVVVPIATDNRVESKVASATQNVWVADTMTIAQRAKAPNVSLEVRGTNTLHNGRLNIAVASQFIAWDKDPDHDNSMNGQNFDIVLGDGTVIPCYNGDSKANIHTGNLHMFHCGGVGRKNNKYEKNKPWSKADYTMIEFIRADSATLNFIKKVIADAGGINSVRVYNHQNVEYATTKATAIKFSELPADGVIKAEGTTIGTASGDSNNTNNVNNTTEKCCDCARCDCSSEDANNSDSSGGTVMEELTETPGVAQGIYSVNGKTITGSEFMSLLQNRSSTIYESYKDSIGLKPQYSDITGQDKWRDKYSDGIGTMHYVQFTGSWAALGYQFESKTFAAGSGIKSAPSFSKASCGIHATAIVASTLLHRYITPAEMVASAYMTPVINPDAGLVYPYSDNVFNYKAAPMIYSNFKYEGESILQAEAIGSLNKEKIDATLDNGGMVILCVHNQIWTYSGHFIVIREKTADGKYLTVDSSCTEGSNDAHRAKGKPSVAHDWSDFTGSTINANQVVLVTPTKQYETYMQSRMKAAGIGDTGSTGISSVQSGVSPKVSEILNGTEKDVYNLLFGANSGINSYSDINKIWLSKGGKEKVKALVNSRMTTIKVPVWKYSGGLSEENKVKSTSGNIQVNAALSEYYSEFLTEVFNLPEKYVLYSIGGFNVRSKTNSVNISGHSFGGTLDINPEHMPGSGYSKGHTYMAYGRTPPSVAELKTKDNYLQSTTCAYDSDWAQVAKKYGLNWGGNWSSGGTDPMHFSIVGDESSAGGHFPNYNYTPRWK